ncbi:MAG: hypothetical protein POH28_06710 [Acidocella sp.]|nr:hypothetical protein [Acidocella sp.]
MKALFAKGPEIFANFIAPYLVYQMLDARFGDVDALIASAVPPLLWSGYELARTRRLDAVSVIVVSGILLTVGATFMGGSARLIQMRDALVTGAIGVMFLATLAMEKPMIFYLARAMMARDTADGAAAFEAIWQRPGAPRTFRMMTGVWGAGLVLQTALMCYLAWIWPIGRYLLLSPFISYGIFGVMMVWSLRYRGRRVGAGV